VTLWLGRVENDLAPEVADFLRAGDAELLPYDCEATWIHAGRLHEADLLTDAELAEIESSLAEIRELEAEELTEDEDVHTAIERLLGEPGRKIHAGRSRNDQVAAAMRLYVQDACAEAVRAIGGLARAVLQRAEDEAETPMPGYTHLQRAQPVTAGALAGSTLGLPLPASPMRNSLDAVADRDFALDYLYACAVLFGHLSRIGEEICLWATAEFGFAGLPEAAATGSSAMPQKLNPDVAELARGKAGTALGRLAGLLAVVKGLPLAYDRDLQEDKTPVFGARRDVRGALDALTVLVGGLSFDRERLAAACADPLLLATDAAEALVSAGTPFRDAHKQVAGEVRDGTFAAPPSPAARPSPGPGGVRAALEDARARFAT
jgi:argininosuccinate lyase